MKQTNKQKRFFIIIFATGSIFLLSWFELFLQKKQHFIGLGINKIFLFFLINLQIIILAILLYLIIKQSIKLIVERKRKIPGSLFKKNLLFAFSIFSVIPSIFVFFIATNLITKSIDNWFDARIGVGIENSLKLHELQTEKQRNNLKKMGNFIFPLFEKENSIEKIKNKFEEIKESNKKIDKYQFYIWNEKGTELFGSIGNEVNKWREYRIQNDRSTKSLRNDFFKIIKNNHKTQMFDFYGSLYLVKPLEKKLIILAYRYPKKIRDSLIELQNSFYDYQQIKSIRNPITWGYLITFILITLLILFLAIWCAFYLAKGISKPIQEILKAIEKIRHGNWDVKVNYYPKNDLKTLSIGFNEMTKTLKEVQQKLENKNKEMSAILENIKASVFFVNKFGRILTYNSASKILVQKYLGLSRFKNKKINFFGSQIQITLSNLSKELIKSEKNQLTKEISFPFENEIKTFMIHLTFIENSYQFSQEGLLIVIEDLSDIVKANKIKTWQEAAKQIAHEIKNPLTPIQLATQRLQRKFKKEQKEDTTSIECTNTILNHVKIIKDLITHFSNLSTMPASTLESVDINKLTKETCVLYEVSYPNFNFDYELEGFLPLIKLDRKKIKRVIVNLIDNSIRAIQELDQKENQFSKQFQPSIKIKTSFKKGLNQIELLISDNGPGIPKDVKNKLFLPYVSGSKKNMGLGLAIVNDIITQLKGTIKLIPSNQGATFQILLQV